MLQTKQELISTIESKYNSVRSIDLFRGKLGISVTYFYYSYLNDSEYHYDLGMLGLVDIFSIVKKESYINQRVDIPYLGYIILHLEQSKLIEIDTDILDEVDKITMQNLNALKFNFTNNCSILSNVYYLLSRISDYRGSELSSMKRILLTVLLEIIAEIEGFITRHTKKEFDDILFLNHTIEVLSSIRFLVDYMFERNSFNSLAKIIFQRIYDCLTIISRASIFQEIGAYQQKLLLLLEQNRNCSKVISFIYDVSDLKKDADKFSSSELMIISLISRYFNIDRSQEANDMLFYEVLQKHVGVKVDINSKDFSSNIGILNGLCGLLQVVHISPLSEFKDVVRIFTLSNIKNLDSYDNLNK